MSKETEPTFYGMHLDKVNEIDERLYLLIRDSIEDKEKDFLITEDEANKVYFSEALEQILFLIKTINETEVK